MTMTRTVQMGAMSSGNCCDAEREFAARHGEAKRAHFARIIDVCLILDHRAPCGPGYGPNADAPTDCDVDCHCGRHLRTPAIAERYVRLQDRARRVAR